MLKRSSLLASFGLIAATVPASAHVNPLEHGALAAGFLHPLGGADHLAVMVLVGVWAAMRGARALWAVPAAFVAAMLGGFGLALAGLVLPVTEAGILASLVTLGLLVAVALPVPTFAGAALVALFGLFHGAAHGAELGAAAILPYALGFMLATSALHGVGIGLWSGLARWLDEGRGRMFARLIGGSAALTGLALALATGG